MFQQNYTTFGTKNVDKRGLPPYNISCRLKRVARRESGMHLENYIVKRF
jgi:hypothetical protein